MDKACCTEFKKRMREILFRGKQKDTGEWVYGCLLHDVNSSRKYGDTFYIADFLSTLGGCSDCGAPDMEYKNVRPKTVGQYTGLKDKNGVKIFEWDIVDWKHKNTKGFVDFTDGAYFVGEGLLCDNLYGVEVIGNIHDNPELLKGEEEANAGV